MDIVGRVVGLRGMRTFKGLSQSDLAEKLGVTQPVVSSIELSNPSLETIRRYASALGARARIVFDFENGDAIELVDKIEEGA